MSLFGRVELNSSTGSIVKGLNQNVKMTNFHWKEATSKAGAPYECLEVTFDFKGQSKSLMIFDIKHAMDFSKTPAVKITDPNNELFKKERRTQVAYITQLFDCFIPKEESTAYFQENQPTTFKEYILHIVSLLPEDYSEREIDVFMEYGPVNQDGNQYLDFPKPNAYDVVFAPSTDSIWVETIDTRGNLTYLDENQKLHPFKRSKAYLSGKKWNKQDKSSLINSITESTPGATGFTF